MAAIQERIGRDGKKVYRARVRMKGYPIQTATFDRKTDAKIWAQQIETSIHQGRYFKYSQSKKKTVSELIDRYLEEVMPTKPKSMRIQTQQLNYWKDKIGDLPLNEVTPSQIIMVRNEILKGNTKTGKRGASTVNRYLAALSHCFTIAMKEWEWVNNNPFLRVSKLKENRGRTRYLSDIERQDFLAACRKSQNPYLYIIVVLALSTGARRNEILTLKWANVDFKRQVITLHETKNGETRLLPLHGHAHELIKRLYEDRAVSQNYLFPSITTGKPIEIKRSWETAIRRAGIEDFRFHDLRHSAASYLAMSGASVTDIAEVLGHKTLQMVKRYTHLSDAHTSKIIKKMNNEIFSLD